MTQGIRYSEGVLCDSVNDAGQITRNIYISIRVIKCRSENKWNKNINFRFSEGIRGEYGEVYQLLVQGWIQGGTRRRSISTLDLVNDLGKTHGAYIKSTRQFREYFGEND